MPESEVSVLLQAWSQGDRSAVDRLLPLVYEELHRAAEGYMRRERQGHTLQPTALINQAYLQMAQSNEVAFQNRPQFIGIASNIMRRILVDHARERHAEKRGGKRIQVELEEDSAITRGRDIDVLVLEDALARLERLNARQAKVVEMRAFGGLSVEEIAAALDVSPRSVKRDWMLARMWLSDALYTGPATKRKKS